MGKEEGGGLLVNVHVNVWVGIGGIDGWTEGGTEGRQQADDAREMGGGRWEIDWEEFLTVTHVSGQGLGKTAV